MAAVSLTIQVPTFNFDIVQGQDLILPVKYETEGVSDTLANASFKMAVLLTDYSKTIDLLSTANNRIEIVSANNFVLKFPSAITSAYKVVTPTLKLIYGLELTRTSGVKRLFEGTITVKREQTK